MTEQQPSYTYRTWDKSLFDRPERMKRQPNILAAFVVALCPSFALANGLIPAINAYRNTPEFGFIFAIVVLMETLCVRLWLRRLHLTSVLWRMVLINGVSSFAGYVLMRSPFRPDFTYVWQQAIPFFFLTLCVELPLFLILFTGHRASLWRKLLVGTVANVLSYTFLIVAERPVNAVWLDRLRTADQRILQQWANTGMLAESTGLIYGTESGPGLPHRLRFFNPREQKWHSLTNCPPIDPQYWDVEGDLAAFMLYQKQGYTAITVRRLPEFAVVAEISVTNAINSRSGWDLQISPDRTKLAVLVPLHEISAPLRGADYQCFGMTCDLVVYEIGTGRLVGVSPRKAFRGLCWLPDSRRVLFTSLRNEALHDATMLDKGWRKKYPDADRLFSDAPNYAYDSGTGSVEYFGEMKSIHLAAEAAQLVHTCEPDSVCTLDPATSKTNRIQIGRLGYRDISVSPDGRFVIVHLTLKNFMNYFGYSTIVDLKEPARRYYLAGFDYRLDWTMEMGGRTRGGTVP